MDKNIDLFEQMKRLSPAARAVLQGVRDARTITERFEEQAARVPDAVAVVCEEKSLTYRELNERANRLAHYLRQRGVGPEVMVGLCLDRSPEMITAVLGILKAGGAYVPLDPSTPPERIAFLLEDSNVPFLITQKSVHRQMPAHHAQVIDLEADAEAIAEESRENPAGEATADHLAYVIYTSGSTGKPKGVCITHRNVDRLLTSTEGWFAFGEQDVWTMFHSYAFDFSVWEMYGALLYGGKLVVVPYLVSRSPEAFYELLDRERVTVLNQTPSAFLQLMQTEELQGVGSLALRYVIFGGEALELQSLRGWMERHGDRTPQLVNMYGITETTVHVTYRPIRMEDVMEGTGSVIGVPIPDLQVHVLDEQMQPVPAGVVGEMYIGGAGVARGYLNRPNLTAERFVADPFSEEDGAKLYKSGDLAHWQENGELVYRGRIDHQVKVRGFRIELGEIEFAMCSLSGVQACVASVREDAPGEKRIVAYVTVESGAYVEELDLRDQLKERLPEYMLPSAVVVLEQFPLTVNGKVDRAALPAPSGSWTKQAEESAPRTWMEDLVAGLFEEILQTKPVGLHRTFFDLGGHSLLATQMLSRIRSRFGVEVPLRSFFENSTVAGLAGCVEEGMRAKEGNEQFPLIALPQVGSMPLSSAQERLWLFEQLVPETATYNLPFAMRMKGTVDAEALERAFQEVVNRHEVLRTNFRLEQGQAVQVVHDQRELRLARVDLSGLSVAERETGCLHTVEQLSQQPFRLTEDILLRISLLSLAEDEHLLLMVMHHIVSDGWSMGVFLNEIGALYNAFVNDGHAELSELPIQYKDYTVWQRNRLQGDVMEELMHYWEEQLAGELPVLQLPTQTPRPSVQTYRGRMQRFALDADLLERLKLLSRREGVTLYMTLLAAFKTLLHRYTGQEDIVVGSPVANRNRGEIENVIGFFVNMLAMRTELDKNMPFRDLLHRVRDVAVDAYMHQDAPFEKVVERLQPERNRSYSPLFQVLFVLQNAPLSDLHLTGLELEEVVVDQNAAPFDLTFSLAEERGALSGLIQYNTDLFAEVSISRMIEHFRNLLVGIADDAERTLLQLPMLTASEHELFVVGINDTRADYPDQARVQDLFEEQVRRTPDRVAVKLGEETLTYLQLNERANRLAHYLQQRGVQPDTMVGIYMERSFEMIIAILGVLKAGGAYVPLDPAYPQERIAFMLQDTSVPLVLTRETVRESLPHTEAAVICVDAKWPEISRESAADCRSDATADHLAYVIYTSGSTGLPKGVLLEHRGLCNLADQQIRAFEVCEDSVVIQFASFNFDVSVSEIFAALLAGATLCLAHQEQLLPGPQLIDLFRRERISVAMLTPSLLALLVGEDLPDLKTIVTGGESTAADVMAQLAAKYRFINVYGATEATVFSTYSVCADGSRTHDIGLPIANSTIYVLDDALQPQPIGVPGEVYIGGVALARGYLNRPELTNEKFIPHPFAEREGERLYRTGDLARCLPDGSLEYMGRLDNQIKLRGFRIELGEIERVLNQHSDVRETVVLLREDVPGDKRLVAYLLQEQAEVAVREIRRFAAERLPNHMVPSAFVVLDAFPLTPNRKVDKTALPMPDDVLQEGEDFADAPRTFVEELLAGIWKQVLNVGHVSPHDNFFERGGHSLMATQAASRIRETFGVDLPLQRLFDSPTLRSLAEELERALSFQSTTASEPLKALENRPDAVPLSFAQQRLWLFDQLNPGSTVYNAPAFLRLRGRLHVEALEQSLSDIVRRHEVLRTVFAVREEDPVQVVLPPAPLVIPVASLETCPPERRVEEAMRLGREEAQTPFDLQSGPLFRPLLIRLDAEDHVLVLSMHHIISDGWSLGVFNRELRALYEAFCQGLPSPLPELSVQYADYSVWQRRWLQGETLQSQVGYWKRQLQHPLPVLNLPHDFPRPAVQSFAGRTLEFRLPKELRDTLQRLSQETGSSLYMTLMAAFQTLLYCWSGQDDLLIGTPIANRNRREVEDLIGFFVNTLVIRTSMSRAPAFREVVTRVRNAALAAYTHQDVPYERIVEELQPERSPSYNPVFQAMFTYHNTPEEDLQLPELQVSPLSMEIVISKFDLHLHIREEEDGLIGWLVYSTDLFKESTIRNIIQDFEGLLEAVREEPDASIQALAAQLSERRRKEKQMEQSERRDTMRKKFAGAKPKPIQVSSEPLVRTSSFPAANELLTLVEPAAPHVDLLEWVKNNRAEVERLFALRGGVLFRGFAIRSVDQFEQFTHILAPELAEYKERSTPRSEVQGKIYTSTEYPADQHILLHNENSYAPQWPLKIWFHCVQAAVEGGETPIADSRKVFDRISPATRAKFMEKGVLYVRNYGAGLDLPWQTVYQTEERAAVEAYCRETGMEFEWLPNDCLRTRALRPAVAKHPQTGEWLWFNQAHLFHVSSLPEETQEMLFSLLLREELPRNTYYGDGTEIEPDVLDEIRAAYRQEAISFPWQEGDIMMLDNMRVAHGRAPFAGARKVVVAMADISREYGLEANKR